MVSFRNYREIKELSGETYLVHPLDRVIGSTKCGTKSYEVGMNVSETVTFTRNITDKTHKINHKLKSRR